MVDLSRISRLAGRSLPTLSGHQVFHVVRTLMIEHPEDTFDAFVGTGVTELLFHLEATRYPFRALQLLGGCGIRKGVAINPATEVESVVPLLDSVDTVLLMSVEPGFGGQSFLPGTLAKVQTLRSAADRSGKPLRIAVDGGVDVSNAAALRGAGADELVAGTAFFRSVDPARLRADPQGLLRSTRMPAAPTIVFAGGRPRVVLVPQIGRLLGRISGCRGSGPWP